jgi:hypothetical protein
MAIIGRFTKWGMIIRLSDDARVPVDPGNFDYQGMMKLVAAGDTITPYVEPIIDLNVLDLATINDALIQDGSIVRALGLVMFQEINKLRVIAGVPEYTLQQFKNALKAQIR